MASTAELEAEILAEMEENPDAYTDIAPVNDTITIDPETKMIRLPASETLFGVEGEKDVERKYFKCPRIVGDNIDLFTHQIYVNYIFAENKNGTFPEEAISTPYWCDDVALDETGNYITFSWLLSGNVLAHPGFIAFAICAKYVDGEALKTRWKTTPAIGNVLMTVPDSGQSVAEMYPDIISQLLNRMDEVEAIATPEEIQNYVEAYLAENPPSGMTAEEKAQLQKNTEDISSLSEENAELKGDLSQLSEEMEQLKQSGTGIGSGTGWNTTQINLLETIGYYLAFTDQKTGQTLFNSLIASLRNSTTSDENEEPENPDATLTGITAEYTGGDVVVGTSVTDLTGITVTATYSDGSVINVTGYALFGEIVEGENTITVSYGGLETTFTVTGVTEPSGEVTPTTYTITNNLTNVSADNSAETIDRGASYTATLTPSSNYYIDTVTVTMGGVNVTDTVYADGVITIAEVTGNVVIVASAKENDNLIVLDECESGYGPDGTSADGINTLMTPFIAVTPNTTYYHNFTRNLNDGNVTFYQKMFLYDAEQNYIKIHGLNDNFPHGTVLAMTIPENIYYVKIAFDVRRDNVYFGKSGVII